MEKYNTNEIPQKVISYIKIQVAMLMRSSYFRQQDKDDLMQELILFYLEKLKPNASSYSDAFLFISIKNFALRQIRNQKVLRRGLINNVSYDEIQDFLSISDDGASLAEFENKIVIEALLKGLSQRERDICLMILGGTSINEISRGMKIAKKTIYKILRKIQKIDEFWKPF